MNSKDAPQSTSKEQTQPEIKGIIKPKDLPKQAIKKKVTIQVPTLTETIMAKQVKEIVTKVSLLEEAIKGKDFKETGEEDQKRKKKLIKGFGLLKALELSSKQFVEEEIVVRKGKKEELSVLPHELKLSRH